MELYQQTKKGSQFFLKDSQGKWYELRKPLHLGHDRSQAHHWESFSNMTGGHPYEIKKLETDKINGINRIFIHYKAVNADGEYRETKRAFLVPLVNNLPPENLKLQYKDRMITERS